MESVSIEEIPATLERIQSMVTPDFQSEVRIALLKSWCRRDLAGMIPWFEQRKTVDQLHQEARDQMVQGLAQREPGAMLAWMEASLAPSVRNELYSPFFRQWACADPASAGAKLRQCYDASPERASFWGDLIGQVAAQWASGDLHGAITWSQSLPDGPVKSLALLQVSYRWTALDPVGASAFASQQNDPALLGNVAGIWAATDPNSAVAWATGLPAGAGRDAAVSRVIAVLAQKSPEAALAYADRLPADETRNRAMVTAISIWADSQPARAAGWVLRLPEGMAREQAFGEVLNAWVRSSAGEADQWLKSLPQNRSRDIAVTTFCDLLTPTNPGMAFQSAGTIASEAMRCQVMERTAIQWIEKDPEAARISINRSTLPESIKKQVLASAKR